MNVKSNILLINYYFQIYAWIYRLYNFSILQNENNLFNVFEDFVSFTKPLFHNLN